MHFLEALATLLVASIFTTPTLSHATVAYSMNFFRDGNRDVLAVEILITGGARKTTIKRRPVTPAGARRAPISKLATFGPWQATLGTRHPNESTWVSNGLYGRIEVDYFIPVDLSANQIEVGGPAFLLYVVEHRRERCELQVLLLPEWRVRTDLRVHGYPGRHTFEAKNFADLVRHHITLERVPAENTRQR